MAGWVMHGEVRSVDICCALVGHDLIGSDMVWHGPKGRSGAVRSGTVRSGRFRYGLDWRASGKIRIG